MPPYGEIRDKIEEDGGDGPGIKGPKGSLNLKGGVELVIKYKIQPTGSPAPAPIYELHHIVPYLIGKSRKKDDEDDNGPKANVLLAWKYQGATPTAKPGFRCYMVDSISLPSPAPIPSARPPLSTGPTDPNTRKKLKLKRQNCVDDW